MTAAPKTELGIVTLPHNWEAEMALLGAILMNNAAYDAVAQFVNADDFADDRHRRIFEACAKLIESGRRADPITLKNYFDEDGSLVEIGGTQYLARLAAAVVTIINAPDYAKVVRECAVRRKLIDAGQRLIAEAQVGTIDLPDIIDKAARALEDAGEARVRPGAIGSAIEAVDDALWKAQEAMNRGDGLVGIPSGLTDLDRLVGGYEPGNLYVKAGRPSMGKTGLGLTVAVNLAQYSARNPLPWNREGKPGAVVLYCSLEMSKEQLGFRLIGPLAKISPHNLRTGNVLAADLSRATDIRSLIASLPLIFDDTPGQTIMHIRAAARSLKRRRGLAAVVIDHIGLMKASEEARRKNNRAAEMSEISAELKALAKDLNAPIIALHQLSRAVESRDDKRPILSDLRDSGTIEQDADVVMFVYRDSYYLERAEPKRRPDESDTDFSERMYEWAQAREAAMNIGEIIVAKQRNGPVKTVRLKYDEEMMRWENLAHEDAPVSTPWDDRKDLQ